ncbi:hypothetical protein RM648_14310 [Mammaliicoccus sciuri]|nr:MULTISPECIES: hypothetical protein [Mammaliicoccus]MDT0746425.1 hypothetical protein [Mammaliicoccus sciuri]MDT0753724.1 hypothetical protein [Mammaliicoccus sciuri]
MNLTYLIKHIKRLILSAFAMTIGTFILSVVTFILIIVLIISR